MVSVAAVVRWRRGEKSTDPISIRLCSGTMDIRQTMPTAFPISDGGVVGERRKLV